MPLPLLAAYGITAGSSALLNWLGARSKNAQQEKLRQMLLKLYSVQSLGSETNSIFDMFRRSPMYTGMRREAMVGSTSLANSLQNSFAARGLDRSGMAGLAMPIARTSFQNKFAGIDMNLFSQALSQARENLTGRASALTGTYGPGTTALTTGGTLESIMPLVSDYFKRMYPGPKV